MTRDDAARAWTGLPAETRLALQRTALLDPAAIPPWLVTRKEQDFDPAFEAKLAISEEHDLWGTALILDGGFRAFLQGSVGPRLSDEELRASVGFVVGEYCGYFVWPPTEMLWNAQAMEPHAEQVAGLVRRLDLHGDLARLQHQRALLLAWRIQKFEHPLAYATEAVAAFRKTDGGKPHPGTLALILTGLAAWLQLARRFGEARDALVEAEGLLIPLVGRNSIEPFLLYCQLRSVYVGLNDQEGAKRAEAEARVILAALNSPQLEKQIPGTLSWAQWHLQRYIGL